METTECVKKPGMGKMEETSIMKDKENDMPSNANANWHFYLYRVVQKKWNTLFMTKTGSETSPGLS